MARFPSRILDCRDGGIDQTPARSGHVGLSRVWSGGLAGMSDSGVAVACSGGMAGNGPCRQHSYSWIRLARRGQRIHHWQDRGARPAAKRLVWPRHKPQFRRGPRSECRTPGRRRAMKDQNPCGPGDLPESAIPRSNCRRNIEITLLRASGSRGHSSRQRGRSKADMLGQPVCLNPKHNLLFPIDLVDQLENQGDFPVTDRPCGCS